MTINVCDYGGISPIAARPLNVEATITKWHLTVIERGAEQRCDGC